MLSVGNFKNKLILKGLSTKLLMLELRRLLMMLLMLLRLLMMLLRLLMMLLRLKEIHSLLEEDLLLVC